MRDVYDLGLTYDVGIVDAATPTLDLVREYVSGFGWRGLRTADVMAATKRSRPSVLEALGTLVAEGNVSVRSEETRGRRGSPRKRWYSNRLAAPLMYEDLTQVLDVYFAGSDDELAA